ncbi:MULTISPECIES: HTTM domain-containing protein [unclassified Streptomyces]|uniref:HTTM domain-containing protein n=1 Tax=unclassified Streptomyces TaxID=2593676 RepID=UPI001CBC5E4B|nr:MULTISPECIES: HTTM domain-containing protein [unclassified Streptomyces]WPO72578.1 HTTM domain-containing protein [Streptomyces sp. KN37]
MTRIERPLVRGVNKATGAALGPYQTAVVRIGFAATWLLFLLREFPHRHEMYGPDGPWDWDMARQLISGNHAFTVLMWSDGRLWFEVVYALAMLSSALLMLGWRTRTMSVLFMIGVLSLQNRSIFIGDGGDNVIHLMATYLVLTRCGQVWSLDARRAARARAEAGRAVGQEVGQAVGQAAGWGVDRVGPVLWWVLGLALSVVTFMGELSGGWLLIFWGLWLAHGLWGAVGRRAPHGELRKLLDVLANIVHNAGLLLIMVEACLIYATAGWYKIQGSRWQDGTAVYYPLNLDYFSPWPALSDLLSSNGVMLMLVTYGTVAVQVAFPFTLINRRVKNVLLAAMIFEHAVIAVVLGLPFFSLAMIAADAVFLPTSFLLRLGGWAARARGAVVSRVPRARPALARLTRRGPLPRTPTDAQRDGKAAGHARVGFTP